VAAVRAVFTHERWRMRLVWDDGEYEGGVALVSVGNGQRTGGAFHMTPEASLDDGLLDFVFTREVGRMGLMRLLPTTFDGSHIKSDAVQYERTTHLTIECHPATPIHADGELFDRAATHFDYRVLPAHLRVLVPA